ncbi:extracellular solute-binding protein [Arenivirga flava]|uniref:Lipoprotein LipO n=1 Tax=Arenivirga flava TaxID=1930060 RepID=A0AA37UBR2_9MICO|nr:extracellular solute-binding protein [Arenivirga flava]GMA27873.1 lipoprotein LipO [Arenivirga flava]
MTDTRRPLRIAVVSATTAAMLALAGCSSGAPVADDGRLSMMVPYLSTTSPSGDNAIHTALEEIAGVELDITWVPNSSYADKTNITLAGDDVPQVMIVQGKDPGFVKNAEAGAFWNLTEHLADYPNLTTTMPEVQEAASINGEVYGVFRARDVMRAAVIIRKDWLEALGLPLPQTTDDLYEIAKAFSERDPDGNGVDDTYGLIIPKWPGGIGSNSPYDVIETWHGAGNRWTERGGELVPSFTTEQWLDGVDYAKRLVDEGLVNADYATLDSADWNQPFLNGDGGIIIDVHSRAGSIAALFKQADPEHFGRYVDVTGNLTGPGGELLAHPTAGYSGFLAIPKASVPTEEALHRVLEVLDALNSDEAWPIVSSGLEGVTYELDGDFAVPIEDAPQDLLDAVGSYAQLGTNVTGRPGFLPKPQSEAEQELYDKRRSIEASDLEAAVYDPAAGFVSATYAAQGAQLDTIIADARIQYIAGQIDRDGLLAAIERWRSSGGDRVIDEINALADDVD